MVTPIQPPLRHLPGLQNIRDLNDRNFKAIQADLENDIRLSPAFLGEVVERHVSSDSSVADITSVLLSLLALMREKKLTPDTVVKGITSGLSLIPADKAWGPEEIKRWCDLEDALVQLLSSKRLQHLEKAVALSYEYSNLLQKVRIITDIRPVYEKNESEELEIEAAMISQTLKIDYTSDDGRHSISMAMDIADLKDLEKACGRAVKKANAARGLIQDGRGKKIPVEIAGE